MRQQFESLGDVLKRVVGSRQQSVVEADPHPPVCPVCHGGGFVSINVPLDDPRHGVAFPCKCKAAEMFETIENFNLDPEYPTLLTARDAVVDWLTREGPAMLVLFSQIRGVGKSHLALAALRELKLVYEAPIYVTDRRLDSMIRESFTDHSTGALLDSLSNVPVFIHDDYGTVARDTTMNGLIDDLYNLRWVKARDGSARTLVTTNVEAKDLPARLQSRLQDVTRGLGVKIVAPDYRQKRRQE